MKLAVLFPLARFLNDRHGKDALERASKAADVSVDDVLRGKRWVSVRQIDAFLEFVFELLEQDETAFRQAASYCLEEAYGPLRYVLWALSPKAVYKQAMKNFHVVSACGGYTLLDEDATTIRVSFKSTKEASSLLCWLRQSNIIAMPTFWGLPPAEVVEKSCLSKGHDECIYEISWRRCQSWWPALIGMGAGLGAAFSMAAADLGNLPLWLLTPALGLALGHVVHLKQVNRANLRFAVENQQALQQVAQQETEARKEIVALTQRQNEWVDLMEEQLADRSSAIDKVIRTIGQLQAERVTKIQGYSHDLRSPLTVMKFAADILKFPREKVGPRQEDLLRNLGPATEKMERILNELMTVITSETQNQIRTPEQIPIDAFTDQVRRQLKALVHGREIRVSVFSSREAPEQIETDRLRFDRVIDNLLSNAVKYTERGSIVVEVDGTPGFLSVKISDSGRGIAENEIERIFHPRGSSAHTRAKGSYGLGLSVVVRLLDEIGGRLEVLSKPGQGTTFWVFLPERLENRQPGPDKSFEGDDDEKRISRVVTIRKKVNGAS
jgi:signal transduction histidine kinase